MVPKDPECEQTMLYDRVRRAASGRSSRNDCDEEEGRRAQERGGELAVRRERAVWAEPNKAHSVTILILDYVMRGDLPFSDLC